MITIYLVGAPASGKSTLADAFLADWTEQELIEKPFAHRICKSGLGGYGIILGKDRKPFSGTDTLGHTAIVNVESIYPEWARRSISWVFGEGDRLAVDRFMDCAKREGTLFLFYLDTPEEIAQSRRISRANEHGLKVQNPTWVAGRKTKSHNLAYRHGAYRLLSYENDPEKTAKQMKETILEALIEV